MNRFELVRLDEEHERLEFKCAHFDRHTRRCDSYDTRPGACRDYPRMQLDLPWPELHEGCGYRAVARNARAMAEALDRTQLTEEQREQLKKRLHVIE